MMRDCNKRCIAAVNGKCAVEDCQGEIRTFEHKMDDAEAAARLYDMAREIFDEDFSKEVPHE